MAFDVSGLVATIKDNSLDFSSKALTTSKIFDVGFSEISGLKAGVSQKLPLLEQTAPFYAASSCAVNASGTTTITQASISTTSIAVSPEWCYNDLEAYFTMYGLGSGANTDSWSGFSKVSDRLAAQISKGVGKMLMQGKTTTTNDTQLKQLNGILASIDANGTAINGNTGSVTVGTGITTSNALSIMDAIIAAIPNRVFTSNMPTVLMGYNDYRTLCTALRNANAYNFYTSGADFEGKTGLYYPGTSVRIIPINDMNNDNEVETGSLPAAAKNRILALNPENIVIGYDKKDDFTNFDVWFDQNTRKLKMYCRFSFGVTAKFYNEIVQFQLV